MRGLDRRALHHLRPARGAVVLMLGAGLADGLLTVAQAFAMGALVVDVVSDPGGEGWHAAAMGLALVVLLRSLASYGGDMAAAAAASTVSRSLRSGLLEAATRIDGGPPTTHRTADVALLATRGTASVEPYLTRYLPALVLAGVLPVATLAAIFALDWVSGVIVLCTLPLLPLFAALIGVSTRDRARRQWQQLESLAGHFLDVVRGLPTLVAYRRAQAQSATIREVTERYRRATAETLKLAFASSGALELIATLSVALVAVSVGLRLASGSLGFQVALTVLLLAPEAYWPLRRLGAEFHASAEGIAVLARCDALWSDVRPQARAGGVPPCGSIEVDRLCVGYGGRPVLMDLSASIASPGLTAVVGPSGCGKTTLLAALVGEVRPSSGEVLVGGTDVLSCLDTWRAQVAWAPQRPWLFHGTLADNVRIGRPDATDDDLWEALRQVGLEAMVAASPLGLATPLGEDGLGLSAGERARVALARVVVADRPYVLLDEPTAHLDQDTEAVFLQTLRWLSERSTVVVVAHRPAVAEAADRVLQVPAAPGADPPSEAPTGAATGTPTATGAVPEKLFADTRAGSRGHLGRRTGIMLGTLSVASGVALTATAAWLITRASQHPPVFMLLLAIVAVRTFGLARPALRYAERLVSHDAALRLLADTRAQVYDVLVPLVPGRLGMRRGQALAAVVDDVEAVVDQQLRVSQPLWTACLVGGATALFATLVSPVAGAVVALVVLVGIAGTLLTRWATNRAQSDFVRARSALSTRVEEVVASAWQLDLWQARSAALAAVDRDGDRLACAARRSARGLAAGRAVVRVGCATGPLAVAAVVPASVGAAMLALLVMLPLALGEALIPAVDAGALSVRTREASDRLCALASLTPAVTEPAEPAVPCPASYRIDVDGVTAGWDGVGVGAAHGLSFTLRPGQRVGVVGPSGSGKSTVAALLLRFIDPSAGTLFLGGTDLRALRLRDTRGIVGLVDDDPYVFSSTLAENVRFARPGASDAQVEAALRQARLGEWLDLLPAGLGTRVGEGHASVSGGERARIGIARSILADQPVIVLDEPTAHLDAGTAQAVADDLLSASHGRSVVWITHGTVGLDAMDDLVRLGVEPGRDARLVAGAAT